MLNLGLDLSRKRLDVCALDESGEKLAVTATPPDTDGLRELVERMAAYGGPVPGVAWILGYTIASEIGDISRSPSPKQLVGYTGLCPRVIQSGTKDYRGPLAKNGPKYLRWALIEAAVHAAQHPVYAEHYQCTKSRLGRQRGAKVTRVEVARKLAEAIWHMLQTGSYFSPARSQCLSGRA